MLDCCTDRSSRCRREMKSWTKYPWGGCVPSCQFHGSLDINTHRPTLLYNKTNDEQQYQQTKQLIVVLYIVLNTRHFHFFLLVTLSHCLFIYKQMKHGVYILSVSWKNLNIFCQKICNGMMILNEHIWKMVWNVCNFEHFCVRNTFMAISYSWYGIFRGLKLNRKRRTTVKFARILIYNPNGISLKQCKSSLVFEEYFTKFYFIK